MKWQRKEQLPLLKKGQIIIAAQSKKSKGFQYAVVFYYKPMKIWYGGAGLQVKTADIEWWADIPAPGSRGRKRAAR